MSGPGFVEMSLASSFTVAFKATRRASIMSRLMGSVGAWASLGAGSAPAMGAVGAGAGEIAGPAGVIGLLEVINNAADEGVDWRAVSWLLEHRLPQGHGRAARRKTGPSSGPVDVEIHEVVVAGEGHSSL